LFCSTAAASSSVAGVAASAGALATDSGISVFFHPSGLSSASIAACCSGLLFLQQVQLDLHAMLVHHFFSTSR
jgi:hypothetical protein